MRRSHAAAAALVPLLVACPGGDPEAHTLAGPAGAPAPGVSPAGPGPASAPGDVSPHTAPGPNESKWFLAEPHQDGQAARVLLTGLAHGRLVDVYGLIGNGRRSFQQRDFLISPDLIGDGVSYLLETHPATGEEELVILRDLRDTSPGGGLEQYFDLLRQAEAVLVPLFDAGLPGGPGPWPLWPRNGAVMLRFDDLVDAQSIGPETVRLVVGDLPLVPFEARVLPDRNHGGWTLLPGDSRRTFHTTRVLVDPAVSDLEALAENPPLPVNWLGLPPATAVDRANVALRLPTRVHPPSGQLERLVNLAGRPLSATANGTIDPGSPTADVVRAARSGGPSAVTGDAHEGFLPDDEPPRLLAETGVQIQQPPLPDPRGDGADFFVPAMTFASAFCAETPDRGAALVQGDFTAVVTRRSVDHQGALAQRVNVRLMRGDPARWPAAAVGPAQYVTPWDPVANAGQEACFVHPLPQASGWPGAPGQGLHPSTVFRLRFSEPVHAGQGAETDALHLLRTSPDQVASGFDRVPGQGVPSQRSWDLLPLLSLAHQVGSAESYWLAGPDGPQGPRDLVGNPLADPLPPVEMTLDPAAATERTGGHVTRFSALDEEPPFGAPEPRPEWSGQHLYDLARQEIRPRPVVHFEGVVDRNQPIVKLMTAFPWGVQTPLTGFGAKAQLLWRYADLGYGLDDAMFFNLDVEGMAWAPVGGAVIAEAFTEFEIVLSHGRPLPDEYIDPASLFPRFPNSGQLEQYADNYLDSAADPPAVVHPRSLGYTVDPGDVYVSPGGTQLMPWPLNQDLPPDEHVTYTWRDTALRPRAGKDDGGAPLLQEFVAHGLPQPSNRVYPAGEVRAEALPLLMEFRCWPDAGAVGLNAFDVSLAANSSSKPYFRAFSAGGIDQSGNTVLVDPDLETEANGGFNSGSNPPGAKTFGLDNVHYLGALDFVVRVSRSYSIWFPALDPLGSGPMGAPSYVGPLLEGRQPPGTAVEIALRGLTAYSPPDDSCGGAANHFDPFENALTLDLFGDHYDDNCLAGDLRDHRAARENPGMTFLNGVDDWLTDPAALAGAVYHQLRLTCFGDPVTARTPRVSTLGLAWSE